MKIKIFTDIISAGEQWNDIFKVLKEKKKPVNSDSIE